MTPLSTKETVSTPAFARLFALIFGTAALAIGMLLPAAASAAPSLDIELTRDEAEFPIIYRGDQQVHYTVRVSNTASPIPQVGDSLFCDGIETTLDGRPKNWNPGFPGDADFPSFSFEWHRDGGVIPGQTSQTYTLTDDDRGRVIQCLVKGQNVAAAAKYASQPGLVPNPQPATPPPVPSSPIAAASRPGISGSGTGARTCTAPTNWTGSPSFTYQWLRNGEPISGATATTYTPDLTAIGTASSATLATGTGSSTAGSNVLTLTTSTGTFTVGESITGIGIPFNTTIAAVDTVGGTITLSAPSTSTSTGDTYTSGSRTLTAVNVTTGAFSVGDPINGGIIQPGATVVSMGAGTITLSSGVTSAVSGASISKGPDSGKQLQCQAIGTNAGGRLLGISNHSLVNTPPRNPNLGVAQTPAVQATNTTSGPVSVDVELPGGLSTFAYRVTAPGGGANPANWQSAAGWTCSLQFASGSDPARATCTRSDPLNPGASYSQFVIRTGLGVDVADPAVATATVSGGGSNSDASVVSFDIAPARVFGISSFDTFVTDDAAADYTQAGGHPFIAGEVFAFNRKRKAAQQIGTSPFFPVDTFKTQITDTPRGFVGNALAIREVCPSISDIADGTCSRESVVGGVDVEWPGGDTLSRIPVYAIEPEFGRPAQFAISIGINRSIVVFYPRLRAEDGYAMSFESAPAPMGDPRIMSVDVTLCGFGANQISAGSSFESCKRADQADPDGAGPLTGANPKPLITNPTKCVGDPPKVVLKADSWENPRNYVTAESIDPMPTNCAAVPFDPEMSLEPTSNRADSPTGMDVEIFMPTDGLETKDGIAQSTMKRVTVTLPKGMAPNPAFAHGLGACSAAQVGIDPDTGVPNNEEARCPDSSKIGTVEIDTPIVNGTFTGDVFLARQGADNPFDSNLAMYMVFSQERFGITVKVAGEVKPDPVTGRLTVVFDENPEWPFSSIRLNFPQGSRSPLLNPPTCGTYNIRAEITPWSALDPDNPTPAEIVEQVSTFEVTEGPNGGPCPPNNLEPKFSAGTTSPVAGGTSPFVMRLHRDDGTQRFTGLTLSPPQGLTAYLKGIPYCSDSTLAAISSTEHTAQAQFDSPSCPSASQIGTTSAGAGAGDNPFYVNTGRVYLAGPYKGAPLSVAAVVPVLAGPFDLGSIVTRVALHVNPRTAEIKAVSDPIPAIWHGILVDVRDLRVNVNRDGFMLNPTSCAEKSVGATITGAGNDIASTGDDSTANVSSRFQVDNCAYLGFKPKMTLRLRGGTKRGKHPALTATLEPGVGDANIANISVALPRSEFLENAHIRTVCTRPDFAADNCPAGAIYGRATVYTPLLDEPLTGPVYLRSSDNLLPDLVPDLRGPVTQPIKIESSGRTDSINGGIRNTFDFVPDAPFTRFVLRMQGGKKGLLVNSRDICRRAYRATVKAGAHNGRTIVLKPRLQAPCGKKKSKKSKRANKRGR